MLKNIGIYLFILTLAIVAQLVTLPVQAAQIINKVIASIEGEPLTYDDLRNYLKAIGKQDVDIQSMSKQDLNTAIQDMMSLHLIEKEAETLHLTVSNAEIEAYIKEVMTLNSTTEKQFIELLKSRDLTLPAYKEQVRRDIYKNKIIMSVVRNSVHISEEDIDRYMDENPNLIPVKGQVVVEELYYRFLPDMSDTEKEIAVQKIRILQEKAKSLSQTDDFSLKQIDQDHYVDLGYLTPSELKEELQIEVNKLATGEVSDLIQTSDGLYILHLVLKSDEPRQEVALRKQIRDKIFSTKYQDRVEQYFNEDLPKKYFIEMKL
ncbi:MAG: SurA N-terminal domain-containing protein [Deltaproteobacteria bacterium]|nr:SurA N-terminal domain-containing protein [Deltaproteobacteria bacterium]